MSMETLQTLVCALGDLDEARLCTQPDAFATAVKTGFVGIVACAAMAFVPLSRSGDGGWFDCSGDGDGGDD